MAGTIDAYYRNLRENRVEAFEVGGRCYAWPATPLDADHVLDVRYAVLSHIREQSGLADEEWKRLEDPLRSLRAQARDTGADVRLSETKRFSPLAWDLGSMRAGACVFDLCRILEERGSTLASEVRETYYFVHDLLQSDPFRVTYPDIIDLFGLMIEVQVSEDGTAVRFLQSQMQARQMIERRRAREK